MSDFPRSVKWSVTACSVTVIVVAAVAEDDAMIEAAPVPPATSKLATKSASLRRMAPPSVSRNANPHANGLPPQVIGGAASSNGFSRPRHSPITLPQHPDQHRSERPVL